MEAIYWIHNPARDNSLAARANKIFHDAIVFLFHKRFYAAEAFFSKAWRNCPTTQSLGEDELLRVWEYFSARIWRRKSLIYFLEKNLPEARRCPEGWLSRYFLYLELLLIDSGKPVGLYQKAIEIADQLHQRHPGDYRLDDIRARARDLQKNGWKIKENPRYGVNPWGEFFCSRPFKRVVFMETGQVSNCCTHWVKTPMGRIEDGDFNAIWNSETAKAIRHSASEGNFEYCNKMNCPFLRDKKLPARKDFKKSDSISDDVTANGDDLSGLSQITFSQDATCNLTCPSCRNGIVTTQRKRLKHFEDTVLADLLKRRVDALYVSGYGDPFASQHYRNVLMKLDSTVHDIGHIHFLSNGLMLNQDMWEKFQNLEKFKLSIGLSIDAARPETYKKIRRGGDWDQLIRSLDFIQSLKYRGIFERLTFAFVIQADNFEEMPEFVDFAMDYGASHVRFLYMHQGGEFQNPQIYKKLAVHLKNHSAYEQYKKVLNDPRMQRDNIEFI